ncbi:hypothetical protein FGB62_20g16 [Gracilaria domingensis]|nr:hypothetical protein FGB62_20g16 [Gracilaria domingensis]
MVTEINGDDDLQRTDKCVPVYDIGSPSFAGGEGPRGFAVITRRIKEAIKVSYNSVTRNPSSPGIQSFEDKNGQCRSRKKRRSHDARKDTLYFQIGSRQFSAKDEPYLGEQPVRATDKGKSEAELLVPGVFLTKKFSSGRKS